MLRNFLVLFAICISGIIVKSICSSSTSDMEGYFQSGEVKLYYNIDLPENATDDLTLIIIGHGSGPSKAKDNKKFARPLVKSGYAVMTFDRRGIGQSGGLYSKAWKDLKVSASDLVAAVQFIRKREDLKVSKIGLYGQSQSGWVIPMAASQIEDLDFMVILSGPVVSTAAAGYYHGLATKNPNLSASELSKQMSSFKAPEGDVDILTDLKNLETPGLWVYGAEDRIQPTEQSVNLLQNFKKSLNKAFDVVVYDNAGHSLRDARGKAIDYRKDVAKWLSKTLKDQ